MSRSDWVVFIGHIIVILELVFLVYSCGYAEGYKRKEKENSGPTQDKP